MEVHVRWMSTSKDMGGARAMAAVNASTENIYICTYIHYTLNNIMQVYALVALTMSD